MTAQRLWIKKETEYRSGWSRVKLIYNHSKEHKSHFLLKSTTISPGLARVTCKFTIKMKPRRILHEKTQRFLRSRWRTRGVYINKEQRFKVG